MTVAELTDRIREEVILAEGRLKTRDWQQRGFLADAAEAGLSDARFMQLVIDISRAVPFDKLSEFRSRVGTLLTEQNGQLTPDQLTQVMAEADRLKLARPFVHDRWLPALQAEVAPVQTPVAPDPALPVPVPPVPAPVVAGPGTAVVGPPVPSLPVAPAPEGASPGPTQVANVLPVNQSIVIDWLVPPGAPDPDQPTLTTQSPTIPQPPTPVAPPSPTNQTVPANRPAPRPSSVSPALPVPATPPLAPAPAPMPVPTAPANRPPSTAVPSTPTPATGPPADAYASLVNQEPVRPVRNETTSGRPGKPFLEMTGGIVALAILVTAVLVIGILYLNRKPPEIKKSHIVVPPKHKSTKPATIDPQMSYRWDAASDRTLTLGINASVPPTVKLSNGKIKKQEKAEEISVELAGVRYRWQVQFSNLPNGIYTVKASIPATASGKLKTATEYLKISDLLDTAEGNTAPTRPTPDLPPMPVAYDEIRPERGQFSEQVARKAGKWGLWRDGKWMILPLYDDIGLFHDRRAAVTLDKQTFEIDYFGSRIRDPD